MFTNISWGIFGSNDGSIWMVKMKGPQINSSVPLELMVNSKKSWNGLVVWNMNFIFHFIYGIIPTPLTNIFQDGRSTTNQWIVKCPHWNHMKSPFIMSKWSGSYHHIWPIFGGEIQPGTQSPRICHTRFYPNSRVSITATCDTWWPQSWCWCPVSRFCWVSTTCNSAMTESMAGV